MTDWIDHSSGDSLYNKPSRTNTRPQPSSYAPNNKAHPHKTFSHCEQHYPAIPNEILPRTYTNGTILQVGQNICMHWNIPWEHVNNYITFLLDAKSAMREIRKRNTSSIIHNVKIYCTLQCVRRAWIGNIQLL